VRFSMGRKVAHTRVAQTYDHAEQDSPARYHKSAISELAGCPWFADAQRIV